VRHVEHVLKRWVMSHHDSRDLIEEIRAKLSVDLELPRSSQVACVEPSEGTTFVTLERRYVFVQTGDELIPFLGSREAISLFPSVRVDEGAIKFVLNGADIMRPGVRSFDEWGEAGRLVAVREEKRDRAIAVGRAVVTGEEMAKMDKGPCLRNLHHLGDRFWNLYKLV